MRGKTYDFRDPKLSGRKTAQLLQVSSQRSRRELCSSHSYCRRQVKALGGKGAQVTAIASLKSRLSEGNVLKSQLLQVSRQGSQEGKLLSYCKCQVKALGRKNAQVTATAAVTSKLSEGNVLKSQPLSEGKVLKSQLLQVSSQGSRKINCSATASVKSSQSSRREKCSSHSYRSCQVKALGGRGSRGRPGRRCASSRSTLSGPRWAMRGHCGKT